MRRAAHAALALVGLLAVVWTLTIGAHPQITCRGEVMGPGDVCVNADGGRQQTYEERYAAAQSARPVVGVVGGAVAAFGIALLLMERRRPHADGAPGGGSAESLSENAGESRGAGGPQDGLRAQGGRAVESQGNRLIGP